MTREEMRYKLNELRMMLNDGEHGEEQGVLVEIISELDRWEEIPIIPISALSENKGDLISRQAVLNQIFYSTDNSGDVMLGSALRHRIENLPSVENKGEWIHVVDSYYKDGRERESHWECSKCGSRKSWWGESKFCPDCGADMRDPKDIIHKAIDNTTFDEEAYPNIKEELHKAVDMAEPKGEKGTE